MIEALVEHPTLECLDGPTSLAATHSTLGREGVEGFAREVLLILERHLPVIGVSMRPVTGSPILDPARMARVLAGMAHVWVIPPDSTWALSEMLPERLGVYNGAVRIWWPGLDARATV